MSGKLANEYRFSVIVGDNTNNGKKGTDYIQVNGLDYSEEAHVYNYDGKKEVYLNTVRWIEGYDNNLRVSGAKKLLVVVKMTTYSKMLFEKQAAEMKNLGYPPQNPKAPEATFKTSDIEPQKKVEVYKFRAFGITWRKRTHIHQKTDKCKWESDSFKKKNKNIKVTNSKSPYVLH